MYCIQSLEMGLNTASCATLVQELGLKDHVKLQGELTDDRLVSAYQQCDLFALPNREVVGDIEGFGIVLLEAQACGKPVLTGKSGGTSETIKPDETGVLVDCTSVELIASETIRLLTDPVRMASMGRLGREWTCSAFDWELCAAQAQLTFKLSSPKSLLEGSTK